MPDEVTAERVATVAAAARVPLAPGSATLGSRRPDRFGWARCWLQEAWFLLRPVRFSKHLRQYFRVRTSICI